MLAGIIARKTKKINIPAFLYQLYNVKPNGDFLLVAEEFSGNDAVIYKFGKPEPILSLNGLYEVLVT
jgi:hypothetical protein